MDASQAPSGTYRLETAHSQVLFSIRHLGLTDYYGRFDKISGTLNFNSGRAGEQRGLHRHRHRQH